MNEYPITPAYRIIGLLLAAGFIGLGIFLIYLSPHTAGSSGQITLTIMGTIITLLGGWMMYGTSRLCVTLDDEAVRVRGGLGNRELPLSEIDGYRIGNKNSFFLVRRNGRGFSIPDYISRRDELIKWVKSKYDDADKREREAETKSILQDERYGPTVEDRKTALQDARNLSWGLALLTVVFGILILLWPAFITLLSIPYMLPLLAIFLTWRSNGMLRLSVRKGNPHPTLTFTMVVPAFMVGICAIARFRFYGFSGHAWTISSLAALAATLFALAALRSTIALERLKTPIIICTVVVATMYGFGVIATSNCALDRSVPQQMEATVYEKYVQHGRSTSYVLDLGSWGIYSNGNHITVSREAYNNTFRGDVIHMHVYAGIWGIPWYKVIIKNVR